MSPNVLPVLVMVGIVTLAIFYATRHAENHLAIYLSKQSPLPAKPAPEPVFDTLRISVYQGEEGPTVTLITNHGEVFTKVLPTWHRAAVYIARTKLEAEGDGITVNFLAESV